MENSNNAGQEKLTQRIILSLIQVNEQLAKLNDNMGSTLSEIITIEERVPSCNGDKIKDPFTFEEKIIRIFESINEKIIVLDNNVRNLKRI